MSIWEVMNASSLGVFQDCNPLNGKKYSTKRQIIISIKQEQATQQWIQELDYIRFLQICNSSTPYILLCLFKHNLEGVQHWNGFMVGNLTQPPYWKVERALKWVMSGVPSWTYPEVISASFPHLRMAKQQVLKQFTVIYKTTDCVWNCSPKLNHAKWQLCLLHLGKCTNLVGTIG